MMQHDLPSLRERICTWVWDHRPRGYYEGLYCMVGLMLVAGAVYGIVTYLARILGR